MPYGDYNGPDKPNKGHEGGACNRGRCQCEPANWYNHGSYSWYCDDCRNQIEFDSFNYRDWKLRWEPKCGHPMFETREMMTARQSATTVPQGGDDPKERLQKLYADIETTPMPFDARGKG